MKVLSNGTFKGYAIKSLQLHLTDFLGIESCGFRKGCLYDGFLKGDEEKVSPLLYFFTGTVFFMTF